MQISLWIAPEGPRKARRDTQPSAHVARLQVLRNGDAFDGLEHQFRSYGERGRGDGAFQD